jgi:hypothetical protein
MHQLLHPSIHLNAFSIFRALIFSEKKKQQQTMNDVITHETGFIWGESWTLFEWRSQSLHLRVINQPRSWQLLREETLCVFTTNITLCSMNDRKTQASIYFPFFASNSPIILHFAGGQGGIYLAIKRKTEHIRGYRWTFSRFWSFDSYCMQNLFICLYLIYRDYF